jgi:hypothetical protein
MSLDPFASGCFSPIIIRVHTIPCGTTGTGPAKKQPRHAAYPSAAQDYLEIFDAAHSEFEDRFIAIGSIDRGLVIVVYTEPEDDLIRIEPLGFPGPDRGLVFGVHEVIKASGGVRPGFHQTRVLVSGEYCALASAMM